jgi:hypothetical protein
MALHTLIALTAALAGGTAQDPTMDLQIAAPVLTDTEIAPQVTPASQGAKVTAQFRNAKASEVLEWMEKRGVNFVVNDDDIKPEAKVTLSVTDVPLEAVLDSLAAALGGHWERRDKMRIFHKGPGFFSIQGQPAFPSSGSFPAQGTFGATPKAPMNFAVPPIPPTAFDGKAFDGKAFDKDFAKRMKEMAAKMEKDFGPEFQKKMEQHMKEFKAYTLEDGKLRELQGKEREEALKNAKGQREEALKMSEQQRAEARKMAEKARVDGRKVAEEARKMAAEARKMAEKARAEGQRAYTLSPNGNVYRLAPSTRDGRRSFITPSFPVNGMDMGKFLKSLSSNQKDTQEKRGFIRYDDLTREQKHLLGVRPDGKFEIRLKVNQDEVVIKGD